MPAGHCLPPDAFSSVNLIQGTHRARPWLQELRRPSLGVMGWVHLYTGCVILHEVHSEQASTDIQTRQARCAELLKNLFFVLTLQGKNAPSLVHLFRFFPWVLATITHVDHLICGSEVQTDSLTLVLSQVMGTRTVWRHEGINHRSLNINGNSLVQVRDMCAGCSCLVGYFYMDKPR